MRGTSLELSVATAAAAVSSSAGFVLNSQFNLILFLMFRQNDRTVSLIQRAGGFFY